MKLTLGDILVVCDMDGTLLSPENEILPCDLETIKLFTLLGGTFTVATGRTPPSIKIYPELVRVIRQAITTGGGVLYDFGKNEIVRVKTLPYLVARQTMRTIMTAFPQLGAMVVGADARLYQLRWSEALYGLISDEKMSYLVRPGENLPEGWVKVLFAGSPELLEKVRAFTEQNTYPGIYFVLTSKTYYEMMPKGVSKGSALQELCQTTGKLQKNTYAIGDFFNDLELMHHAGYAVAMANAPKEVRDTANEVTGSNSQGGVGQFLYKLIKAHA